MVINRYIATSIKSGEFQPRLVLPHFLKKIVLSIFPCNVFYPTEKLHEFSTELNKFTITPNNYLILYKAYYIFSRSAIFWWNFTGLFLKTYIEKWSKWFIKKYWPSGATNVQKVRKKTLSTFYIKKSIHKHPINILLI